MGWLNKEKVNNIPTRGGFSLMEILIAMSIFTIATATISYLIIDSEISLRTSIDATKAVGLADEGIEAVRTLRDSDFDNLTEGEHGLGLVEGSWQFTGVSDDTGSFTRTISVVDVEEGVKKITSSVAWDVSQAREREIVFSTYLSDWKNTGGDAQDLFIDTIGANLTATGTTLVGVNLENTDAEDMTLESMSVEWVGVETLEKVTIGGVEVFAATTTIDSGDSVDIDDHLLSAGTTDDLDSVLFSGDVSGSDFMIRFVLSDGSARYAYVEI